jgi:hypothetical protein
MYLLFLLYGLGGLRRWWAGDRRASALLAPLSALAGLALFGHWLSSPTPDIPAALLVWLAGLLFLEKVEEGTVGDLDGRWLATALLACWAVAVKLSSLPILLLPLYLLARARPVQRRPALAALLASGAVILPTVLHTAVLSGYLVYPFPALDLLPVDWKVPAARAWDDLHWVQSWARVPGKSPNEVLTMPLGAWLPGWFERFPSLEKAALLTGLALGPPYLAVALAGGPPAKWPLDRLALVATTALGLAFWFFTAPDARFGWNFLVLLPLLLAGSLAQPLLHQVPRAAPLAVGALALGALGWSVYLSRPAEATRFVEYALLPVDYEVRPVRVFQARNFRAFAPASRDQCSYWAFPCAPLPTPRLELRGPSFAQGIRAHAD